jgi:hypothetical protein
MNQMREGLAERGGFEPLHALSRPFHSGKVEPFDEREPNSFPRLVGSVSHPGVTARGEDRLEKIPEKTAGSLDSRPQYLRALKRGAERSYLADSAHPRGN